MSDLFNIAVERNHASVVLSLAGELDVSSAPELAAVIRNDWAGEPDLVIDLSRLTFMDCAGLRVLLYARARADSEGSNLTLVPGPEVVQRILRLTGVDERLRFNGRSVTTNGGRFRRSVRRTMPA